jgi:hypothetical protein
MAFSPPASIVLLHLWLGDLLQQAGWAGTQVFSLPESSV